jgi:hypothetical protein
VAILFSLLTLLVQCGFFGGEGDQGTGFRLTPTIPPPAVRMELREQDVGRIVFLSRLIFACDDSVESFGFVRICGI